MADSLIVQSKVKEAIKGLGLRTDSNVVDELNKKIAGMLSAAAHRAKANGRSTMRPYDL
ncbi:MAG: hypothetical protein RLZZ272_1447 [Actinomycetota bacterium]